MAKARRKKQRGHTGFWLNVDGQSVHVLGDPNMSEETANAIAEVVRLVRAEDEPEPPRPQYHGWPGPYDRIVGWFEEKLAEVNP